MIPRPTLAFATTLIAVFTATASVPAQKIPLTDDLTLQIHDLAPIALPEQQVQAAHCEVLARFARRFIEPPLGKGQDVELLGARHLAVVGSAAQCAWVENLVQRCTELKETQIDIDTTLIELSAAQFKKLVGPLFEVGKPDSTQRLRVLAQPEVAKLRRQLEQAGVETVLTPRLLVWHSQRATMSVGNTVPYISDFQIVEEDGEQKALAKRNTLFDGIEVDLQAASLDDGLISVDCTMRHSRVLQPLPKAVVEVGAGIERVVHLPRTRQVEFAQQLVLPKDSGGLVAVKRNDGRWLVAIVTASRFE